VTPAITDEIVEKAILLVEATGYKTSVAAPPASSRTQPTQQICTETTIEVHAKSQQPLSNFICLKIT